MQPWMPAFDASKPQGTRMPVWLTLKNVLEEFLSSAQEMVGSLNIVLGRHRWNSVSDDQKFCVAVKTGIPFDLVLEVVNPVNGETTLIQVDYNNLPICCRYCLFTSHLVKNCPLVSGQKRLQRGINNVRTGAPKTAGGEKGKEPDGNVVKKVDPKVVVDIKGSGVGSGTGTSEEKARQENGCQKRHTPRSDLAETDIPSVHEKGGSLLVREDPTKGRMGGASSSSSVDKLKRPQKTIRKGNMHSKPFITWELWKACELATGQVLSPKKGDFYDINEYNNCCQEWRARESLYMTGDRSSDVQLLTRNTQEGKTRRNQEIHLSAAANKQSLQKDGNIESKLTGASRPMLSVMPTDGGRQEDGELREMILEGIEEGKCEGPELERVDENMDRGMNLGDPSEAQGSFDLNHTIHSRPGERRILSDDLGFSNGMQESDSGTAQQNQLPSHMILVVQEWLKGQGLRIQLPSSPLGPRLSKKTMDKRNGPEGFRSLWKVASSSRE